MAERPHDDQTLVRPPRLAAVDVLRGFAMLWLIGGAEVALALVDLTGPSGLAATVTEQLSHVPWEGLHAYDLIFPLFVFTAGISVPLSVDAKLARGVTRRRIALDAVVRAVLLFGLGLVHNGALGLPPFAELRIMGVLQRIALATMVATLAHLLLRRPRDLVLLAGSLVVGYAVVLSLGPSYDPGQNVSDLVDLHVFASGQLFTPTGDPEGLVSTAGAAATALLGAAAAAVVRRRALDATTVVGLAATGVALVELGTIWGARLPIVKQLWTSSFVLVAAGWSLLLFAATLWVVDVRPRSCRRAPRAAARPAGTARPAADRRVASVRPAPARPAVRFFEVIGRGCIVAYVGQDLVDLGATADQLTGGLQRRLPAFGFLIGSATALALRWLVLDLLDRHGLHLRLGLPARWLAPSDRGLELREVDAAEVAQQVAHLASDHDDRVAPVALAELEVAAVDAEPVDRVDVGDRPA